MAKLNYWDGSKWAPVGGGDITSIRNTTTLASASATAMIGISAFDKDTDTLLVFMNSVFLDEDDDYTLGADRITKKSGGGTWDKSTVFDFVVLKSVLNDVPIEMFSGSLINDGTVTNAKLSLDLQNSINGAMPKSGGTFTAPVMANNNTSYATAQMRNVILSTADPTAGAGGNGDIWIKYKA